MTNLPVSIVQADSTSRNARYYEEQVSPLIDRSDHSDRDVDSYDTSDHRTPAQRDRDRILHASAFKRLAGVTQVVDPSEGQVFHNRLTHSLKVGQIARRIAEKFLVDPKTNVTAAGFGIDPDVVEAAALAHDLGHPPFGHLAEQELSRLASRAGLPDAFEGNAQTFRIVTQLELRRPDVEGLNLTRATLNAIMKYPWQRDLNPKTDSGAINKKNRKWGVYYTEMPEFKWVREGWPESIRSVEAEIMDFADDIAYSLHDLEDFSRAGLIPITKLLTNRTTRRNFVTEVLIEADFIKHPYTEGLSASEKELAETLIYELIDFLIIVPMGDPSQPTGSDQATLRSWQSAFITRYVNSISLEPEALNDHTRRPIYIPDTIRHEIKLLQGLTRKYVINSRQLATQQHGKRQVIRELFHVLLTALKYASKDSRHYDQYILPEDFKRQLTEIGSSLEAYGIQGKNAVHARFVADMISSMTDTEALAMHKRLTGINPGSVLDMVVYSGFHLH